ncbi:MAG: 3,4-dioxygenase subunit beta [Aeromicrobium sp.]
MSAHDGHEEHDLGLAHDLPTLLNRRRALGLLSGAGLAAALAACGVSNRFGDEPMGEPAGGSPPVQPPSGTDTGGTVKVEDGEIPAETGGPFPANGSNGQNVLLRSGIVRSDITGSFGGPSGVAKGVPTTIALTLVNLDGAKATPYEGAAIYLWHCDSKGRYSMYDPYLIHQNYLRGVQVADRRGRVTFRSIFPAAYGGRWPHIHFEVYESEESAITTRGRIRTSQIALPKAACDRVYATSDYELSRVHLKRTPLKSDIAFRDGHDLQMAKVTGSVEDGMRISLTIPV